MYLRFETEEIHINSGKPKGIFTLAYDLIEEKTLTLEEERTLTNILCWFGDNLQVPSRFSRKRNNSHKNTLGISWLKPDANDVVARFWELKSILENSGYNINVMKIERPGKVVYEDEQQLVAIPFNGKKF